MRTLYTLLISILSIPVLQAQVIDNGDLETWVDSTIFYEPSGWSTSNRTTAAIPGGVAVLPDSNAYQGSLAAQVRSVSVGFAPDLYAGILTNGSYDTLGVNGPAINYRPLKLTGYYKFSTQATTDSGLVVLYMNRYSSVLNGDELVAGASIKLPTANDWTYFEVDILDAFQSPPAPESYVLVISSTQDANTPLDSDLRIDALAFSGVTSVNDPVLDAQLDVFPNPSNTQVSVSMGGGNTIDQITIYNGLGQVAYQQKYHDMVSQTIIKTDALPLGVHVLQIKLTNGSILNRTIQVIH